MQTEQAMRSTTTLPAVALFVLGIASPTFAEDVLFADYFKNGLSEKWEVVGLHKKDYRVRDGGLEMRVQPGKLSDKGPMFKVVLPFTAADTVIVSVRVTLLNPLTVENEFAGVHLLTNGSREFSAKKQRIDGKTVFAPGKYQFIGKPGERGDPEKYTITYANESDQAGPLRIIVDRGNALFQVGPSLDDKYQNFFHSAIGQKATSRGSCLTAAGAPDKAEHWVRFTEFRVVKH